MRARIGLIGDQTQARKIAAEAIAEAARRKDNPADLINIALEALTKHSFEFPAFSTLDTMAGDIRTEVNETFFTLAHSRMNPEEQARMLAMSQANPVTGRSDHDRVKQAAPRATVSRLRTHLDHLAWLDGIGGATGSWLAGIPTAKVAHFAAEARALDAAEMRDFGEVKRIVLEACLVHQARVRARDDLVTMLCKRMNTMHTKARERLQEIQAEQRERNERLLAVLGELLSAAREVQTAALADDQPWPPVKEHTHVGKAVLEVVEQRGGLPALVAEHEELAAFHGDNHLPLLETFYRSHRPLLLRLARILDLEATTTDRRLLDALDFVLAHAGRTSEYVPDQHTVDTPERVRQARVVDTSFAPEARQKVIRDRRRPGQLVRRHFEICVFSCLADELVRGDIAVQGSEAYANWQTQLLSWEECRPLLADYCAEVGLPATAREFTPQLRQQLKHVATQVDAGYPANADLVIDEHGRPVLTPRKGRERTDSAIALEQAVRQRLPERALLDVLSRTTRHLRWHRHLGPLSGTDTKITNALERYLLVAFTYGCFLGAAQSARHLRGRISAHELGYTFRRHISLAALNKAIAEVVNAYLKLDLPKIWGEGSSVSADGTKYVRVSGGMNAPGRAGIAVHRICPRTPIAGSRTGPAALVGRRGRDLLEPIYPSTG
ncbi:Tn3 family transposase [Streptosporangium sp. NPDC087985]|uniref:Tn3 family transposase n=1 Tax=Streptosporangium sp. NPDC087985 TaxID=3366196 RepID=UPI00381A6FEC